jgi:hypothetical protein
MALSAWASMPRHHKAFIFSSASSAGQSLSQPISGIVEVSNYPALLLRVSGGPIFLIWVEIGDNNP